MPHTIAPSVIVTPDMHGQRLDAVLILVAPELSIRQRRRLFDTHTILVNGIPKPKGHSVRSGDTLELISHAQAEQDAAARAATAKANQLQLRILHTQNGFAALSKPGGIHTAQIAGREDESLEAQLPALFPTQPAGQQAILVNRLDNLTSGIVIAAFGQANVDTFRQWEDAGSVEKIYLAVVAGTVSEPLNLQWSLDTAKRKTTRVLDTLTDDTVRHTSILPLGAVTFPESTSPHTLVLASIHKGARHQIRAHLAHAGFPIAGDPLYGTPRSEDGTLYLHHYHIEFGEFIATCQPTWSQWSTWQHSGFIIPHTAGDK